MLQGSHTGPPPMMPWGGSPTAGAGYDAAVIAASRWILAATVFRWILATTATDTGHHRHGHL
jgi:hypothetical protein